MKIAILLCGHIRNSLQHNNIQNIINEISKKNQCHIYGYIPENKEHSTKTWYETDKNLQKQLNTREELESF